MSVFAAVIDFQHPPSPQEACLLLQNLPDAHFEPTTSCATGAVAVAVKIHRVTQASTWDIQPLLRDGILVAADCRLDNREALMQLLALPVGMQPSDTDLLYHAYRRWGLTLVDYLRGDYSVVIYDSATDAVTAFIDPLSARRLFYRQVGSRIYLSNQLVRIRHGIAESVTLSAAWSANFIVRAGCLMHCPRDITLFEQIRQLAWGQRLTLTKSGIVINDYLRFDTIKATAVATDPIELAAEARRLFEQAVARRLQSARPVACHLSGGLDSSATAVTALGQLAPPTLLTCLHYEPAGALPNSAHLARVQHERERVAALASSYPRLRIERFSGQGWPLCKSLETSLHYADMPLANAVNHCWLNQMAEYAAAQGHQVILSGAGGNFTLSQDRSMFAASLLEDMRDWLRALTSAQTRQARQNSHLLRPGGQSQLYRSVRFRRHARKQRLLKGFMAAKGLDLEATFKNAFGIEHWVPVADYDFARFVWGLPADLYCDARGNKRLVREIMGQRLPERMLDQRLRGVQSPDAFSWYCDELTTIKQYYAHAAAQADNTCDYTDAAVWDRKKLTAFIEQPRTAQAQHEGMLVSVLGCYHLDRLQDHVASSTIAAATIATTQPHNALQRNREAFT